MDMKFYILSLLISQLTFPAIAQVAPDIIRPSVNAEQFSIAVKAESALSQGQLSVNIPLLELKGIGYDLPVSLTFYIGDVTFCTEASPVGLGWSLMAGGVITKTIRGTDDTDTTYSNKEHLFNGNYILNNWRNNNNFINELQVDLMPDQYTYSIPGHSGTIDVSVEGDTTRMVLYPDESYIIESTEHGFCITADDGTKYYFEDIENRTANENNKSTSWFLSRIITIKGGVFTFHYADEEYVDLSTEVNEIHFDKFLTKRITSIVSDFGSVTFSAVARADRGGIGNRSITDSLRSKRINKIEMRDENGEFIKGFELDNSDLFESLNANPYDWCDYRHKLPSVTQYDALGNHLPPYEFTYSYKFSKSRLAEGLYLNGECMPRDSWSSNVGAQAYLDLNGGGEPLCRMIFPNTPYTYLEGITIRSENIGPTAGDYFCLTDILYPTGAADEFTYEKHSYSKVNMTSSSSQFNSKIQGKRLAAKTRSGSDFNQRTEYIYKLHDSGLNAVGPSSGIMTNPSIHCATYYTPEPHYNTWIFRASRLTLGKALNSFMGPPVCYTEVEEVEYDESSNVLNRTIHYYRPQILSPPINYILVTPNVEYASLSPDLCLLEIDNRIYGSRNGYIDNMAYLNNENMIYMTYPVGEFYDVAYNANQLMKDLLIGRDGKVRSVREYHYYKYLDEVKYGYKVISKNYYKSDNPVTLDYTVNLISMSEYITRKFRRSGQSTTRYYYDGEKCDSVIEHYGVAYNKGRVAYTHYSRNNDEKITNYYFPGDIVNIIGNEASPAIGAISELVEKNIVNDPIKKVLRRNGVIIGGECKDYQMVSGLPMLKSVYKLKNTANNSIGAPTISGSEINYHAELYKEGEIMAYDEWNNPEHIKINNTQDRIYVWGYDGRFPVAIIDDMSYTEFLAFPSLKSQLLQLANYRKIGNETDCSNLRSLNAAIRAMLPNSVHITTFTYDPYFGMTSETDDSNIGTIYTYDTFGRLSAKYDINYKKKEEYTYNFSLQQQ